VRAPPAADVLALREHPGDGELCNGYSFHASEFPELFNQREILVEILALKTRADSAKILLASAGLAPVTADEAARKHTIRGEPNPQFAQGRKNTVLDPP
jgi:hypothetical protein